MSNFKIKYNFLINAITFKFSHFGGGAVEQLPISFKANRIFSQFPPGSLINLLLCESDSQMELHRSKENTPPPRPRTYLYDSISAVLLYLKISDGYHHRGQGLQKV